MRRPVLVIAAAVSRDSEKPKVLAFLMFPRVAAVFG
jgi:hypothetical protein